MDRSDIIEFLEVLLCRLQNDGAGARKIDMVAEAMGIINAEPDERTVRAQLLRVNELMESMYGSGAGTPGNGAGGPGNGTGPQGNAGRHGMPGSTPAPGTPDPQLMEQIRRITASAHQECLAMGENFADSAGELAGTVERDINDLAQVRASYDDLMNRQRLGKRLDMVKERYQKRLKRQKQAFIADVTSVCDNAMDKVKNLFSRPEAGSLHMTRKQLYERFDAGHDTFLLQAQNVGGSLDLAGDAFERLAERLGNKAAAVMRKATVVTVLVLLLSMAVWGILLGTAGKKAYDAVTDCMEMVENLKDPEQLLDGMGGMGGMGGMAKMVLDNDMVKNAIGKAVEAPVKAITTLVTAMKTILIILVICVLCFYAAFVPFLIWFRRGLCIRWLERSVLAETSMFLGEAQLDRRLNQGAREMIDELEGMYSRLYQDLWTAPGARTPDQTSAQGGHLAVTEEAAAEELIRSWRQLTVRYGI